MTNGGHAPWRALAAGAIVLLASACGSPATPSSTPHATPAESSAPTRPPFDATRSPLVFFAPLGPRADHAGYGGSDDYYQLFDGAARWTTARDEVDVFQVYGTWVTHYSSDDELRKVIDGVAERGLGLGVEIGPLKATGECDQGEGWAADESLAVVRRIQAQGGRVDVVALDEPYAFGHVSVGDRPCRYPVERVAAEVAEFVADLRRLEPDVIVGDIEPMWSQISPDDLAAWLDAYAAAAGEPFAFLHLDADWNRGDWADAFLATEGLARERNVPFGVIYNGGEATTDAEWTTLAMQRAVRYESVMGGRPEHIIFQSWFDHPDRVLPDTDSTTFSGLIARYAGPRTQISVDRAEAGSGSVEVAGTIVAGGSPVAGAIVSLSAAPLDGVPQELTLTGTVPEGATSAVIGIRANVEDAGPGAIDLTIYEAAYSEGSGPNLVPNPRFLSGLDYWGVSGSGSATLTSSDIGEGGALRLGGSETDWLSIDTGAFAVTPGAEFELRILARVPESSARSAYAALIFLGASELGRQRIALAPVPIALGTATADADGRFIASVGGLAPGRYTLRIDDPGDAGRWPAGWADEIALR